MRNVVVVGAGIAGLTACLRLLERGFQVTLYEQDEFVGGMLRANQDPVTGLRREHSYHMFMNWYYNFWKIAEEIGIEDNFSPREAFKFLYPGRLADPPELVNPGGPQDMMRNLASGAASPPELFLFMYSMIDLLATPIGRDRMLDRFSMNAFLNSRPYATEGTAMLHQKVWETVWAISSDQASAKSYRTFLKYGNRVPTPQLWLLRGNKHDMLLRPLLRKLKGFGDRFDLKFKHRLKRIEPAATGAKIATLTFDRVDKSPSVNPRGPGKGIGDGGGWRPEGKPVVVPVAEDDVIVSVTPGMMADLVTNDLYNADPQLGELRYLQAEPMASVELHLKVKRHDIPDDVTVFMDAKYQMTFLDYSQLWPDQRTTFLYITVSDVKSLLCVPSERRDENGDLVLNLDRPTTAIEYVLDQVRRSIDLDLEEINLRHTSIEMNTGEELFANMVGSWEYRPTTGTALENLFLAGTYVRNLADVSTIEGAVISGLNAAEAVRRRAGVGDPITVIEPDHYPPELFAALKVVWAPLAAGAKLWSMANDAAGYGAARPSRPSRRQGPSAQGDRLPQDLGTLFWDFLPRSLWSGQGRGLGPLFWEYRADGRRRGRGRRSDPR